MCGRFTLHHDPAEVADRFGAQDSLFVDLSPRYNIAPTQTVAAITTHGPARERLLEPLRWGLVPFWAKDIAIGSKLINARAETAAEKPSFKHALARRRCLIPADGFYEWQKSTKQPVRFRLKGEPIFAFAGLFDEWQAPDGSPLRTCTILTTAANSVVEPFHDRMPVILRPGDEDDWLDVARVKPDDLAPFFAPFDPDTMDVYPVNKRVGSPTNDDPGLLVPI